MHGAPGNKSEICALVMIQRSSAAAIRHPPPPRERTVKPGRTEEYHRVGIADGPENFALNGIQEVGGSISRGSTKK
jgi:hypothetical protein